MRYLALGERFLAVVPVVTAVLLVSRLTLCCLPSDDVPCVVAAFALLHRMPMKPIRDGLKMYIIADPQTGYVPKGARMPVAAP